MPLVTVDNSDPAIDGRQSAMAMQVRRGVLAGLAESSLVFLPEFVLPNGRRADLMGIDGNGLLTIIEIKSSLADFNADRKWQDYKDFCDCFYFASHPDVPQSVFPDDEGFILADAYGCETVREAPIAKLPAARRKTVMLRIARQASARLQRVTDFYGSTAG